MVLNTCRAPTAEMVKGGEDAGTVQVDIASVPEAASTTLLGSVNRLGYPTYLLFRKDLFNKKR